MVISEEAAEEEETPTAPEEVVALTDVQPSIIPAGPSRSHNDMIELHRARESLRLMAEATIAQAAAAEQSGNRNARTSDSSRQTATYRNRVPPMPYGLHPAALPFTPQAGAAETQIINPEPVESFRTVVNTKESVPTSVGRRVIEENCGNTDLDEEDDSGRGVRPNYNVLGDPRGTSWDAGHTQR